MACTFRRVIFFVIFNIFVQEAVFAVEELSRSSFFKVVENTSSILDSDDQIIATRTSRSVVHCAHKCLTKKDCRVIGFNAKSGVCWLMKSASRDGVLKSQDMILKKVDEQEKLSERPTVKEFSSCKDALEKGRSKGNGIYNINTNEPSTIKTYCHMDELPVCGGGGWTLTMKINGSKNTFGYDSSYWTNKQALQIENGLGLEEEESKLPTYWSTPLTQICLGMKQPDVTSIQWIKLRLKQSAASLLDVIATGGQSYIILGRNKWKSTFFPRKYITGNPYYEGVSMSFNTAKVRFGIISKVIQKNNWYDSVLGFGMRYQSAYTSVSCGMGGSRELSTDQPAFCYILIQ